MIEFKFKIKNIFVVKAIIMENFAKRIIILHVVHKIIFVINKMDV
jgi:hypothetical protein